MAITHRKGDYNDYDPSRMRPAEFGITLMHDPKAVDGRAVHIAFAAGEDKTLMTFEDAETMIEIAAEEATAAATSQAQQYATNSQNSATESRSYAKGGTSSRSGEDTDNAMYYKNQAANSATAASNSATAASGSASTASTKASEAATSATNASGYANNASASATAAATSAGQAASSATAASGSATAAADSAEDAQEMSYTAEAWAVGQRGGTDVLPTDPTYQNNSKYYLEQAEAVAESIPEDYSELSDDVDQLKNALITDTASGTIASFPDGADDFPVRDLTVQMEPIQDLHGYDHPWPGGGGKNLIKMRTESVSNNGITVTANADGTVSISGKATQGTNISLISNSSEISSLLSAGGVFSLSSNNGSYNVDTFNVSLLYTENGSLKYLVIGASNRSIAAGSTLNDVSIWVDNGKTVDAVVNFALQLEKSSTITAFSPYSNICPITGWTGVNVSRTGKNLLPNNATSTTQNGVTFTVNTDGTVKAVGTATAQVTLFLVGTNWGYNNSYKNLLKKGNSYIMSGGQTTGILLELSVYNPDGTTAINSSYTGNDGTTTFSIPNDVNDNLGYLVYIRIKSGNTVDFTFKPMIRLASDADPTYAPYTGTNPPSPPITFPSEAGTVYGGTVDVTTGVLTVDRAMAIYNTASGFYAHSSGRWYKGALPPNFDSAISVRNTFISNQRIWINGTLTPGPYMDYGSAGVYLNKLTESETLTDLENMLSENPIQVVYRLATPQTYQLTPQQVTTLLGWNNIWSDADSVSVDYVADTKLYIDKELESVNTLRLSIAPVEDGATSSQAYAQGKYFFHNGDFCKAKTAIASGATFTLNTNYEVTTVAAELFSALN